MLTSIGGNCRLFYSPWVCCNDVDLFQCMVVFFNLWPLPLAILTRNLANSWILINNIIFLTILQLPFLGLIDIVSFVNFLFLFLFKCAFTLTLFSTHTVFLLKSECFHVLLYNESLHQCGKVISLDTTLCSCIIWSGCLLTLKWPFGVRLTNSVFVWLWWVKSQARTLYSHINLPWL